MSRFTLYIGNKSYSSWSMRGWLACKLAGIAFDEVVIPLDHAETAQTIRQHSPSGLVPALHDGDLVVWDSLAIGEYLAEQFPAAGLWPQERKARAVARAISAEMHSGFTALRQNMPMNLRRHYPGRGQTPEVLANIARIVELWRMARGFAGNGGPFLFGAPSLADVMFAPVVTRFATYEPPLSDDAKAYGAAIAAWAPLQEWKAGAAAEPWVIAKYDLA